MGRVNSMISSFNGKLSRFPFVDLKQTLYNQFHPSIHYMVSTWMATIH
jgi:hypothetical protein